MCLTGANSTSATLCAREMRGRLMIPACGLPGRLQFAAAQISGHGAVGGPVLTPVVRPEGVGILGEACGNLFTECIHRFRPFSAEIDDILFLPENAQMSKPDGKFCNPFSGLGKHFPASNFVNLFIGEEGDVRKCTGTEEGGTDLFLFQDFPDRAYDLAGVLV